MAKIVATAEQEEFHQAVRDYDLDKVRAMLLGGMSPETTVDGVSALFEAAKSGHSGMVTLLLQAGAQPNRRLKGSGHPARRTALNAASGGGNMLAIEALLDGGADPRSPDHMLSTAAHLMLRSGKNSASGFSEWCDEYKFKLYSALNRMLDKGIDINQPDNKGTTLLHHAVIERAPKLVIDTLVRRGADPYRVDQYGFTPLHYACQGGRVEQYQILARHGLDMNRLTLEGQTPLHICNDAASFEQLMAYKPDLEAVDYEGRTALADVLHNWNAAAWQGKAVSLIAAGANLDKPDYDGVTARDIVKRKKIVEVAEVISSMQARDAMARIASNRPRLVSGMR